MPLKKILIICSILGLSACQAHKNMTLSEWKTIKPADSDFNIPDISPVPITLTQRQDRDGQVRNTKYTFSKYGVMYIQHAYKRWFNPATEQFLKDEAKFKNKFAESGLDILDGTIKKLKIGNRAFGNNKSKTRTCFISASGHRLGETQYDNDFGYIDTIIRFRYCGSESVKEIDFDTMLSRIKLSL